MAKPIFQRLNIYIVAFMDRLGGIDRDFFRIVQLHKKARRSRASKIETKNNRSGGLIAGFGDRVFHQFLQIAVLV
jgi:hypothetical protein